MGVVNVTPDSFSDGGRFFTPDAATERALQLQEDGADIVDIGGESSRPGAHPVSESEELNRVLPVTDALAASLRVPISIDTYKAGVALRAIGAGASIVNDISGLRDENMVEIVAQNQTGVVIMHMKGTPANMQRHPVYKDAIAEISAFLLKQKKTAIAGGIEPERIALDPGIGFGKRLQDNLDILQRLNLFASLESPLLIGVSRKSFIGTLLNQAVDERLEGTLASVVLAAAKGADIVRVHDVKAVRRALTVADSIVKTHVS